MIIHQKSRIFYRNKKKVMSSLCKKWCRGCQTIELNGNERDMCGIPELCTTCDIYMCHQLEMNENIRGHTHEWYYQMIRKFLFQEQISSSVLKL